MLTPVVEKTAIGTTTHYPFFVPQCMHTEQESLLRTGYYTDNCAMTGAGDGGCSWPQAAAMSRPAHKRSRRNTNTVATWLAVLESNLSMRRMYMSP